MGKALSKLGGDQRKKQLTRWKDGPDCTWQFKVNEAELLKRWRDVETQLEAECAKRKKLKAWEDNQEAIEGYSTTQNWTYQEIFLKIVGPV